MKQIRRGLILPGGGAKGLFQFSALATLLAKGLTFDVVFGNSVGTLNGYMYASSKMDLLAEIWGWIRNQDVYEKTQTVEETIVEKAVELLTAGKVSIAEVWDVVLNRNAIYSNQPLFELIKKYFSPFDVQIDFNIAVTALYQGTYHTLNVKRFRDLIAPDAATSTFQSASLASTAQPIVWPCVPSLRLPPNIDDELNDVCDGGVLNVSPIGDILDENVDEVWCINCSHSRKDPPKRGTLGAVSRLSRVLELLIGDNYRGDVARFRDGNHYAKEATDWGQEHTRTNGKPLRYIPEFSVEPEVDIGDGLDFESDKDIRVHHGEVQAVKTYVAYEDYRS